MNGWLIGAFTKINLNNILGLRILKCYALKLLHGYTQYIVLRNKSN